MADFSVLNFFHKHERSGLRRGGPAFPEPEKMDTHFMMRLDAARLIAGVPFIINTSYRDDGGAHATGMAVDIKCEESWVRWEIINALRRVGFNRFGIYDLHIHTDTAYSSERPMNRIWWGESR